MLRALGAGLLAGLAWGVAARGFMRLFADHPAFSWSGTLAIVGTSAVVGALVAVVRSARLSGRRPWWRVLGLPMLVLFVGPGALLLPGVVGVVMLLDRRRWLAPPGLALVGVTLWLCARDLGAFSVRQGVGLLLLAGCVGVLGWAARELVRRWRPGEWRGPGRPTPPVGEFMPDAVPGKVAGRAEPSRSVAP